MYIHIRTPRYSNHQPVKILRLLRKGHTWNGQNQSTDVARHSFLNVCTMMVTTTTQNCHDNNLTETFRQCIPPAVNTEFIWRHCVMSIGMHNVSLTYTRYCLWQLCQSPHFAIDFTGSGPHYNLAATNIIVAATIVQATNLYTYKTNRKRQQHWSTPTQQ